jgi:pyruvate kinase
VVWGVIPIKGDSAETTDEMYEMTVEKARKEGLIRLGDLVIFTAGVPVGRSGSTNLIKVHHVGALIAKGQGIGGQSATGKIVVARTPQEAIEKVTEGSILVTVATDKDYIPAMKKASGVITVAGGITSHTAIVGLNLMKPVIIGVDKALELFEDGMEVSIYAEVGVIYSGKAKVL